MNLLQAGARFQRCAAALCEGLGCTQRIGAAVIDCTVPAEAVHETKTIGAGKPPTPSSSDHWSTSGLPTEKLEWH